MKNSIELGDRAKDIVSATSGIVIGFSRWLTGCETVIIEPPMKEDGTKPDMICIDIGRAEVLEKNVVKLKTHTRPPLETPAITPPDRGGPQPHGMPSRKPSN